MRGNALALNAKRRGAKIVRWLEDGTRVMGMSCSRAKGKRKQRYKKTDIGQRAHTRSHK